MGEAVREPDASLGDAFVDPVKSHEAQEGSISVGYKHKALTKETDRQAHQPLPPPPFSPRLGTFPRRQTTISRSLLTYLR